jgi:hypothetical protein
MELSLVVRMDMQAELLCASAAKQLHRPTSPAARATFAAWPR